MGDKLKPCPFCGCTDIYMNLDSSCFVNQVYKYETGNTGYKLRCEGCGMQTCWWHEEGQAIRIWNRRPNATR